MRLFLPFFLCLVLVHAASAMEIHPAAVVNHHIITNVDVGQRLAIAKRFSGLPDIPAVQQRLRAQMLQKLISETLQKEILNDKNIKVSDRQMQAAVEQFASQRRITVQDLQQQLAADGVSMESLKEQIGVELRWAKMMMQQLQPRIVVSDTEIDTAIEAFSGDRGFQEYQVSEIMIPVNDQSSEADAAGLAQDVIKAIRDGVDVNQLASMFPTLSNIGSQASPKQWQAGEQLEQRLLDILAEMKPGDVTPPVRTTEGYRILKLHDKRAMIGSNDDETEVALRQIILPLSKEAEEETVQERLAEAARLREGIYGCVDFMDKASRIEDAEANDMGRLQLKHLQAQVRGLVRNLGVGQISEPFRTPAGIHLLMVCEKIEAQSALVHREKVKEMIKRRKLGLEALRLMRDARRNAYIEVRDTPPELPPAAPRPQATTPPPESPESPVSPAPTAEDQPSQPKPEDTPTLPMDTPSLNLPSTLDGALSPPSSETDE